MRVHDTLEDNGIDTILANTFKTKIIAQAKIKSDGQIYINLLMTTFDVIDIDRSNLITQE